MSRNSLLINEPPLVIIPSLAAKIGLNEAIVLQQIQYWLSRSTTDHDGCKWTYNTAEKWGEQFPFWSVGTVRRTLASLREKGLIRAEFLSNNKHDRTLFYTIEYANLEKWISTNCANQNAQNAQVPFTQNGQMITETTLRLSTETSDTSPLIPQGGAVADECLETDAFTPEELQSEPLPPPAPRRAQASAKARQDEERTAIMQAFRAVRFGKPDTDPVPPSEFDRMKAHADALIQIGATAEEVRAATDEALNRTEPKYVTLGYLAGHWTEVTTPLPATRPTAMQGQRLTAQEQRAERERQAREAEYQALRAIELDMIADDVFAEPSPVSTPTHGRVIITDAAFARPPRADRAGARPQ